MNFSAQQHDFWTGQVEKHLAQCPPTVPDGFTPQAIKASKIKDLIDAYEPFSWVQGTSWLDTLELWLACDKSTCRSLAVASVAEIILTIADYSRHSRQSVGNVGTVPFGRH